MTLKTQLTNSTLLMALALAVFVHASLLLIKLGLNKDITSRAPKPLTIQLQKTIEQPALPSIDEVEIIQEKIKEPPKEVVTRPIEPGSEKQKIIIDTQTNEKQTTTTSIINTAEYKEWIRTETINHIESNADSVANFADTFTFHVVETAPNTELEISPLGTGMTKVTRNGKILCQLQTVLPFTNSFSSNSFMTYKDCTPPKKFVLNTR